MNIKRSCGGLRRNGLVSMFLASILLMVPSVAGGYGDHAADTQAANIVLHSLTDDERAWLRDHRVIRVVQDPAWPPIEFIDNRGGPTGMTKDYLDLIEQRLGVTFEWVCCIGWQEAFARMKRWEIDMTTSVTVTPERSKFWAFTRPYMDIPIVIVASVDVAYIADMHELIGKKVAVVENYAVNEWIPTDFPDIQLVKVKTAQEGLELLQKGKIFAYVENMLVVGYYLTKLKMTTTLKIVGNTPYTNAQSMAVRKDWAVLAGILDKALDSISETERNEIYRRWLPVRYEYGFNYTRLWHVLVIFTLILLVLAVWIWKLSREIAGRKRAEGTAHESEQRFHCLFNATPMPLGLLNNEGVLTEVNGQWEKCLGYSREEIPTIDSWWQFILPYPDYRFKAKETWEDTVRRAKENKANIVEPHDYKVTCKNGDIRIMEITGTFLADDLLVTFFDVTDRQAAENEQRKFLDRTERAGRAMLSLLEDQRRANELLRESGAKLDAAMNSMTDAVFISDSEGRFIHINDACATFHRFRNKNDCVKTLTEYTAILDMYFPDGELASFEQWAVSRALRGEAETNAEYGLRRKDTGETWMGSFNFSPIHDSEGVIVGSVVVGRDITEQKQAEIALRASEERYRNILEVSPAGITIHQNGKLVFTNPAGIEILGATSRDQLIGKEITSIFHPDNMEESRERIKRLLAGEKGLYPVEDKYVRLDGNVIDVDVRASLLTYNNGPAVQVIVTDITERKRYREKLQQLNTELEIKVEKRTAQLEASNIELEAFSYSVSHDLRAPLRHISGYVDLLNKRFHDALPDKAKHYLDEVIDSASQMSTLIDDLLRFSRTSRQELRKEDVDMNVVIQEVLEQIKTDTGKRKIYWTVAELPRVLGDYSLLKQVWINLLENAVKYTRKKTEAVIEVGFTQESGHMVFFVRDNGVGFDMQYAEKLFGVFQRLHSQAEFEGTGIGLANVQRIVHKHAGRVWADAQPDKGATFYFSLP